MPNKSGDWIQRIKNVALEFHVGAFAAQLLHTHLAANPAALDALDVRPRDVNRFEDHLELTYVVRLYAEFEAGLRDAWRHFFGRATFPRMEVLINRVGALRDISPQVIAAVHHVRDYRNDIIH